MTDTMMDQAPERAYWLKGNFARAASILTGLVAILVALKAAAYVPASEGSMAYQDQIVRFIAFASLTVWISLSIGLKKRATAAMIVLAFASFLELYVVPGRGEQLGTLAFSNMGIVFAYCGLQLYWFSLVQKRRRQRQTG